MRGGLGRKLLSTAAASGEYNYILVGGGTASCVLAKRLLDANPDHKVLVLEAGSSDYDDRFIRIPAGIGRLFKSDKDWDFTSSSSAEAGLGPTQTGPRAQARLRLQEGLRGPWIPECSVRVVCEGYILL